MKRNTNDTFDYYLGITSGSTYAPYKQYTCLLDVSSVFTSSATVLNNTLGSTVAWSYDAPNAALLAIAANKFTANKTWILTGPAVATGSTAASSSVHVIGIWVNASTCSFSASAVPFIKSPIEIRVY